MRSVMNSLKRYFINGLLFVLPMGLTIWFLAYLISTFDEIFRKMLNLFFKNSKLLEDGNYVFGFSLVTAIIIILGLGWLATNLFGRILKRWIDRLFESIPMVSKIYQFIKQITKSLTKGGKSAFKRVVLVNYPHPGTYAVGFVSNENLGHVIDHPEADKRIAVFVPTSPNPTSGFVLIVHDDEAIPLNMSVEDGMKFIISGGTLDVSNEDSEEEENEDLV